MCCYLVRVCLHKRNSMGHFYNLYIHDQCYYIYYIFFFLFIKVNIPWPYLKQLQHLGIGKVYTCVLQVACLITTPSDSSPLNVILKDFVGIHFSLVFSWVDLVYSYHFLGVGNSVKSSYFLIYCFDIQLLGRWFHMSNLYSCWMLAACMEFPIVHVFKFYKWSYLLYVFYFESDCLPNP